MCIIQGQQLCAGLEALGYDKPLSIMSLAVPNFEVVADILEHLLKLILPQAPQSNVETREARVNCISRFLHIYAPLVDDPQSAFQELYSAGPNAVKCLISFIRPLVLSKDISISGFDVDAFQVLKQKYYPIDKLASIYSNPERKSSKKSNDYWNAVFTSLKATVDKDIMNIKSSLANSFTEISEYEILTPEKTVIVDDETTLQFANSTSRLLPQQNDQLNYGTLCKPGVKYQINAQKSIYFADVENNSVLVQSPISAGLCDLLRKVGQASMKSAKKSALSAENMLDSISQVTKIFQATYNFSKEIDLRVHAHKVVMKKMEEKQELESIGKSLENELLPLQKDVGILESTERTLRMQLHDLLNMRPVFLNEIEEVAQSIRNMFPQYIEHYQNMQYLEAEMKRVVSARHQTIEESRLQMKRLQESMQDQEMSLMWSEENPTDMSGIVREINSMSSNLNDEAWSEDELGILSDGEL